MNPSITDDFDGAQILLPADSDTGVVKPNRRYVKRSRPIWKRRDTPVVRQKSKAPTKPVASAAAPTFTLKPIAIWSLAALVSLWFNVLFFTLLVSLTAVVATAQAVRSWLGTKKQMLVIPMLFASALIPVTALISPAAFVGALAVFVTPVTFYCYISNRSEEVIDLGRTLAIPLAAAGSYAVPILLYGEGDLHQWATVSFILFVFAYSIGFSLFQNEGGKWEAQAAGTAVLIVACLMTATFMGTSSGVLLPWAMAASVCIGAQFGSKIVDYLVGPRSSVLTVLRPSEFAIGAAPVFLLTIVVLTVF